MSSDTRAPSRPAASPRVDVVWALAYLAYNGLGWLLIASALEAPTFGPIRWSLAASTAMSIVALAAVGLRLPAWTMRAVRELWRVAPYVAGVTTVAAGAQVASPNVVVVLAAAAVAWVPVSAALWTAFGCTPPVPARARV
jgi:hypothetical protein